MLITISGLPGAGKSTTAALLAKKIKYPRLNSGDLFRALAKRQGMSVANFDKYTTNHPEIDYKLDDDMLKKARRAKNLILEGRLTGALTFLAKIPALRIWFKAPASVRAERVSQRENISLKQALKDNTSREQTTTKRFKKLYNISLSNPKFYNLIINTHHLTPEEIVKIIRDKMKQVKGK